MQTKLSFLSACFFAIAVVHGCGATPTAAPTDTKTAADVDIQATADAALDAIPDPCLSAAAGSACDDGSVCTTGDACTAWGACVGTAISCDDGDPCTDDWCSAATGCSHPVSPAPCTTTVPCSLGASCQEGKCTDSGLHGVQHSEQALAGQLPKLPGALRLSADGKPQLIGQWLTVFDIAQDGSLQQSGAKLQGGPIMGWSVAMRSGDVGFGLAVGKAWCETNYPNCPGGIDVCLYTTQPPDGKECAHLFGYGDGSYLGGATLAGPVGTTRYAAYVRMLQGGKADDTYLLPHGPASTVGATSLSKLLGVAPEAVGFPGLTAVGQELVLAVPVQLAGSSVLRILRIGPPLQILSDIQVVLPTPNVGVVVASDASSLVVHYNGMPSAPVTTLTRVLPDGKIAWKKEFSGVFGGPLSEAGGIVLLAGDTQTGHRIVRLDLATGVVIADQAVARNVLYDKGGYLVDWLPLAQGWVATTRQSNSSGPENVWLARAFDACP